MHRRTLLTQAREHLANARRDCEQAHYPSNDLDLLDNVVAQLSELDPSKSRTDILNEIEEGLSEEALNRLRLAGLIITAKRDLANAREFILGERDPQEWLERVDATVDAIGKMPHSGTRSAVLVQIAGQAFTEESLADMRRTGHLIVARTSLATIRRMLAEGRNPNLYLVLFDEMVGKLSKAQPSRSRADILLDTEMGFTQEKLDELRKTKTAP